MIKLKIENFGPIIKGFTSDNGWMEIRKNTFLIGNQGSGKSTVAKLFSSLTWLEKSINRGDTKINNFTPDNFIEITRFQKSFNPKYPLLPDPQKEVFDRLGNLKGTPQTYFLKKDPSGRWYVRYHHRGSVSSFETYLTKVKEELKDSLEGVEAGYKIPSSFIEVLTTNYPNEPLDNKRMLIYFPSSSAAFLEKDVRNTTTQMKVLLSFITRDDLAIVIVGFLKELFSPEELELLQKTSHIFLIEDALGTFKSLFQVAENPLICLVNISGRIVYRADSLTTTRA